MISDFFELIGGCDNLTLPNNRYHNSDHASDVADACFLIKSSTGVALLLAALYHDCVYIPRAGGTINEDAAAALFQHSYNRSHKNKTTSTDEIILSAVIMIKHTAVQHHLSSTSDIYKSSLLFSSGMEHHTFQDLLILLDADLHTLALDYPKFEIKQMDILSENYEFPSEPVPIKASKDFLKLFLEKDSIYRTEFAKTNWEKKARENISRWVHQ
jgi:predicted metal-dependent HD superfamily phosphohydrolase